MDELNHLGWVVYKSYDIGGYLVGVRTNSEECAEWLDETLKAYEIDDEEAEPYYSLWVPEQTGIGKQYYVLYREADDLLRTLDPGLLAERLFAELSTFLLRRHTDAVFTDYCVVEHEGIRALVPSPIIPYMRLAGRRVERDLTLPLRPTVGVRADGRLVSIPRQVEVRDDAADDLAGRLGVERLGRSGLDVPESVDVVCAFHYDPTADKVLPLTRAMTVHALAEKAYNLDAMQGAALEAFANLVDGARCYLVQNATAAETFELLKSVMRGDTDPILAATA
jgi:hypothetical protein